MLTSQTLSGIGHLHVPLNFEMRYFTMHDTTLFQIGFTLIGYHYFGSFCVFWYKFPANVLEDWRPRGDTDRSPIYGGTSAASSPEGHKYFALPV